MLSNDYKAIYLIKLMRGIYQMLVNNSYNAPPMKKPEIIMLHEIIAVIIDILKKDCGIQIPEPEVMETTGSVIKALEFGIQNL